MSIVIGVTASRKKDEKLRELILIIRRVCLRERERGSEGARATKAKGKGVNARGGGDANAAKKPGRRAPPLSPPHPRPRTRDAPRCPPATLSLSPCGQQAQHIKQG